MALHPFDTRLRSWSLFFIGQPTLFIVIHLYTFIFIYLSYPYLVPMSHQLSITDAARYDAENNMDVESRISGS
jgi:hypothetical protein